MASRGARHTRHTRHTRHAATPQWPTTWTSPPHESVTSSFSREKPAVAGVVVVGCYLGLVGTGGGSDC